MISVCITFGVALILLGAGAYWGTGRQSVTALIPACFGVLFVIFGLLARDGRRLKLSMHLAATVALLGLAGGARGIPGALALLGGAEIARPVAAVVQSAMAVLCAAFLVLAVRSFIAARREREAADRSPAK